METQGVESGIGTEGRPKGKGSNPNSRSNLNPANRKKPVLTRDEVPILEAMRQVAATGKADDKTHQVVTLREWQRKFPKDFMERLLDLEKAALLIEGKRPRDVNTPEIPESCPVDEGSGRVEELIERLVKEARGDVVAE